MFFSILATVLLQVAQMKIGDSHLFVEIADTASSQEMGLMHRETLPPDHGMLFVYNQPEILSFWMKNTKIPLSVGFFDQQQRLLQIEHMNPPKKPDACPVYQSKFPAKYALEVPQHWFEEHKIAIGNKFSLETK